MIFDEPLEGLDPLGRNALKSVMGDLRAAGHSVLFSTHVLSDVEAQIAAELQHPEPQTVVDNGRGLLEQLAQLDIICSTRPFLI